MAGRNLFLIAVSAFLLGACATVVPLTGGEEDAFAPSIEEQSPEQGALYYSGNKVALTFDEYVTLNDPANTISMNPSAGKLTTELKNKTVTISWTQTLAASTTYILQLNGAVRDLHEGNDSIMQLVFSTGSVIDSLTFGGKIVHAFSNQLAGQMTVGLYAPETDPYTTKPLYAARSNVKGEFEFSYLKEAPYKLFAFLDQNKDQLPQVTEQIAFSTEEINFQDTVPIILQAFSPAPLHNRLKAEVISPGLMIVYNRDSLDVSAIRINEHPVELMRRWSPDSVLVALPDLNVSNCRVIYGADTVNKPLFKGEQPSLLKIAALNGVAKWRAGDSLFFSVNDAVMALHKENIRLTGEKGNPVNFTLGQKGGNSWYVIPDRTTDQSFAVFFDKGAVNGRLADNDTVSFKVKTLLSADLSNLKISCPDFEGQWILELTQNDKVFYSATKAAGDTFVEFLQIEPGQYGVRCIEDRNGNGKWDTGNYSTRTLPERILRYTLTQKLRANWDIEETLTIKP